jgi:hypothetical protein
MIINTAGKSTTKQEDNQMKGLQVLLTPEANLPPGSLTSVANHLFIRIFDPLLVLLAQR